MLYGGAQICARSDGLAETEAGKELGASGSQEGFRYTPITHVYMHVDTYVIVKWHITYMCACMDMFVHTHAHIFAYAVHVCALCLACQSPQSCQLSSLLTLNTASIRHTLTQICLPPAQSTLHP